MNRAAKEGQTESQAGAGRPRPAQPPRCALKRGAGTRASSCARDVLAGAPQLQHTAARGGAQTEGSNTPCPGPTQVRHHNVGGQLLLAPCRARAAARLDNLDGTGKSKRVVRQVPEARSMCPSQLARRAGPRSEPKAAKGPSNSRATWTDLSCLLLHTAVPRPALLWPPLTADTTLPTAPPLLPSAEALAAEALPCTSVAPPCWCAAAARAAASVPAAAGTCAECGHQHVTGAPDWWGWDGSWAGRRLSSMAAQQQRGRSSCYCTPRGLSPTARHSHSHLHSPPPHTPAST